MTSRHNRLRELEAFVASVAEGGVSAGARRLGAFPSGVSRMIQALEARLGVALLARGPRLFRPTAEGEVLYERARRLLADLDDIEQTVSDRGLAKGTLRVSMAVAFGRAVVLPLLARFRMLYPEIRFKLSFTDRYADLNSGETDLALRFGPLPDSDLAARLLVRSPRVLIASPSYIETRGAPQAVTDLAAHDCIRLSGVAGAIWPFSVAGVATTFEPRGAIEVDDGETLAMLALLGHGIARVSRFHVRHAIEDSRLVELLDAYRDEAVDNVYAVFPGGKAAPERVRVFVEYLARTIDPRSL